MNLVIDSGNSNTKIGYFQSGTMSEMKVIPNKEFSTDYISKSDHIIISTVSDIDFSAILDQSHVLKLNAETALPFSIQYSTPQTLGTDRIAAVAGAYSKFPEQNCLVINAGTCITTDFIDHCGVYQGGSISPGIQMRYKALNQQTAKLPLINTMDLPPLTGQSTHDAISSGVLYGALAEAEGIIATYTKNHPDCKIIITGGDYFFFETNIKATIFAVPELVLIGLNSILEHNVLKA
jgi:type III pantothenate kinase